MLLDSIMDVIAALTLSTGKHKCFVRRSTGHLVIIYECLELHCSAHYFVVL